MCYSMKLFKNYDYGVSPEISLWILLCHTHSINFVLLTMFFTVHINKIIKSQMFDAIQKHSASVTKGILKVQTIFIHLFREECFLDSNLSAHWLIPWYRVEEFCFLFIAFLSMHSNFSSFSIHSVPFGLRNI